MSDQEPWDWYHDGTDYVLLRDGQHSELDCGMDLLVDVLNHNDHMREAIQELLEYFPDLDEWEHGPTGESLAGLAEKLKNSIRINRLEG